MTAQTPAELRAEASRLLEEAVVLERPVELDELKRMSAEEIVKAREQGRLDKLLGADYYKLPGKD